MLPLPEVLVLETSPEVNSPLFPNVLAKMSSILAFEVLPRIVRVDRVDILGTFSPIGKALFCICEKTPPVELTEEEQQFRAELKLKAQAEIEKVFVNNNFENNKEKKD